ncbi:hypothetical protein BV20DRAFT_967349 [Pilatotrama ljubarskyi]|nr:hypothetical protein BV20DRAFT_967349 [Pilatotrama ljubarskyi]
MVGIVEYISTSSVLAECAHFLVSRRAKMHSERPAKTSENSREDHGRAARKTRVQFGLCALLLALLAAPARSQRCC